MNDFFSGFGDLFSGMFGGANAAPPAAPDLSFQAANFIMSDWGMTPTDVVRRGWESSSLDPSFWSALQAVKAGKGSLPISELMAAEPGSPVDTVYRATTSAPVAPPPRPAPAPQPPGGMDATSYAPAAPAAAPPAKAHPLDPLANRMKLGHPPSSGPAAAAPGTSLFGSAHKTGLLEGTVNGISDDAAYMRRGRSEKDINSITYHWDVTENAADLMKYGQRVDPKRGFDAGYHFYVDRNGTVHQGAPLDRITNHQLNGLYGTGNKSAIGIVMNGASDGVPPTPAQVQAAIKIGEQLAQRYNIPFERIFGHGEVNPGHRSSAEGMAAVNYFRRR